MHKVKPPYRNSNGHYSICNSQLPLLSGRRLIGSSKNYHCNCYDVEVDYRRQQNNPPKTQSKPFVSTSASFSPLYGRYSTLSYNPRSFFGVNDYSSLSDDELAKHFYESVTGETAKKYKIPMTYDRALIEAFRIYINNVNASQSYNGHFEIDLYEIYEKVLIALKDVLPPMAKPVLTTVKIGMNIALRHLSSQSFVVKPLKGGAYYSDTIHKDSYWVLSQQDNTPPFMLYEFPVNQGMVPKTDVLLFIDPWTPDVDDCLVDYIYKGFGISLMKKFDISQAGILLKNRKKLFDAAPTATNTILLFQLMDAIILNDFKTGALDLDRTGERNLIRLEKLKNLALSTKFNEERKNAVDKSFLQFEMIVTKKEEKVG